MPKIETILERQAKSWEVRRRLAGEGGEAAREALAHLREGPWLSVSRQRGSHGLELARKVGEKLGWEVYDREILSAIAQQTRTRETILSRLDEEAFGPIKDYISSFIVPNAPGRFEFLEELTQVIWGLAKQGNAVMVGRGANWFLDPRYGLRVRVVGSLEQRVARVAAQEGLDLEQARKQTLGHDARRKEYIQKIFRRDLDDPLGYDMVLNLDTLGVETATEVVLTSLRCKLHAAERKGS